MIIAASVTVARQEDHPIDITFLVGRLEELIGTGRRLPTTNMVIIDRELALGFIDELRAAIPEEVSAAKRISAEGARIVEKAREEAERTVGRAQEQAAFLIEERGLTQAAEKQSGQIIAAAQAEGAEIRRGADEYAAAVLIGLEGDMIRTLQSIKKGISALDERRSAASGARPLVTGSSAVEPLSFNVAGLLGEPAGSTRDYPLAGITIPLQDDRRLSDPIEGRLRLTRTNRGILVRADLATGLEAECSRCLLPIEVPLALRLDDEVLPSIDISSGLPIDRGGEPDVARLSDHHELDLEPLVREAIDLAEPIAPLCRADCPGLCPQCGERLEGPPHDHPEEVVDPRLEALRAFRVDGEPGSE